MYKILNLASGGVGAINSLQMISAKQDTAAIVGILSWGLWTVISLYHLVLYRKVYKAYRNGGLSAQQAKNEAVKAAGQSGALRQVGGAYIKSQTGVFK